MKLLSISSQIIKACAGQIVDVVYLQKFAFGKEAALHQIEIKTVEPFKSPEKFEETMHDSVLTILELLRAKFNAQLLGTGMHPTLQLEDTTIWPHTCQDIYNEYGKLFNLKSHGWRNIQSFQLNLPYYNEPWAIAIYNSLAHLCSYLPAISASSPIIESELSPNIDSRLYHYKMKTKEIPSIAGDIIPRRIFSFNQLRNDVFDKYSMDLAEAGATEKIRQSEWMDQRGIIIKPSRSAIEVRVMDEQECIKSDVALSCFIRSAVRGLIDINCHPSHNVLVNDYNSIVANGLAAKVLHPQGKTARDVCKYFLGIATEYASKDEKRYLWVVKKRIEEGNLSEIIRSRVIDKSRKTSQDDAILSIYLQLGKALLKNQPYF